MVSCAKTRVERPLVFKNESVSYMSEVERKAAEIIGFDEAFVISRSSCGRLRKIPSLNMMEVVISMADCV
jgi:hypothetical protein